MTLQNEMYTIVDGHADTYRIRLHADHPIYQAHFPGNPITPGVCLVKMVSEVAGQQLGRSLQLRRIVNLKFVSVISPVETPELDLKFTTDQAPLSEETAQAPLWRVKGTFSNNGQAYTKFSLELSEQ